MRLIDADALLEADPEVCADYGPEYGSEFGYSREQILNAPTVDAVPVVRCRDCISSEKVTLDNGYEVCYCVQLRGNFDLSHFCSWGERDGGADDAAD